MIDYLEIAQKYHDKRNDGFITDVPKTIQLADDDYNRIIYDAEAMQKATDAFGLPRCVPSRPSRIKYSTARKLINQYRKKYAKSNARLRLSADKWGL